MVSIADFTYPNTDPKRRQQHRRRIPKGDSKGLARTLIVMGLHGHVAT